MTDFDTKNNGYVCFYKDKRTEVYAETSYAAALKAAEVFKTKNGTTADVTVVLAKKNGEPVTHTPDF